MGRSIQRGSRRIDTGTLVVPTTEMTDGVNSFCTSLMILRSVNLSISLCMQFVGGQAHVLLGAVLEGYSRLSLCYKVVRGTNKFL